MATNTIVFRPSADIYVNHIKFPTASTTAFNLINEEVSDGAATYIRGKRSEVGDFTPILSSSFKLNSKDIISMNKFIITDVHVAGECYHFDNDDIMLYEDGAYIHIYLNINGNEVFKDIEYDIKNLKFDYQIAEAIVSLNNYIALYNKLPELTFRIETKSVSKSGETKTQYDTPGLTQIYFTIMYEEMIGLNIFSKSNGTWKQATKAYQKQNGMWTEITEEEAKTILASNIIVKS